MSLTDWKGRAARIHSAPVANANLATAANAEAPTSSTFAEFATFAFAEAPERKATIPEPVELNPLSPAGQVAAFERFGERAAILEYESGLPRAEAERRARREAACERYHRTWWPVWERGRAYLLAHPEAKAPGVDVLRLQMADAVVSWNQHTGDSRTQAEYLAHLAPADFEDRELMTPGALALYAYTLWRDDTGGGSPDGKA